MKKIFGNLVLRTALMSCAIVLVVTAFVAPVSCRLTEEGIEILPADVSVPSVESFSVRGRNIIHLDCSERIVLDKVCVLEEGSEEEFAVADAVTYSEDGKSCDVELSKNTLVGKNYVFSGKVFDITGNSLEFSQTFTGFNENPARLMFNEVYVKGDSKNQVAEFVEFVVLKSGNICGLELVSASKGEEKKYSFPAIDVKRGDYIVVHGRTAFTNSKTKEKKEIESFADEDGDDICLSKSKFSCDSARDLWREGDDKIISDTDVLILRDGTAKNMKDAVLFSADSKNEWKPRMKEFAEEAHSLGIWDGGSSPSFAISSSGAASLNRSISRKNTNDVFLKYADENSLPEYICTSSAEWIVTEKSSAKASNGKKVTVSGVTPGFENSANPYIPK